MGAVSRRGALLLLAIGLNGCRCNSVDDRELPAPAASVAPSAPAPSVSASAAKVSNDECGPDIGGIDAIASAPAVILGELHGLTSAPAFTADLACRLAFSSPEKTVHLALEIPADEQGRIDTFLGSPGGTADRSALTAGPFWATRDGRSSVARVDMLERIRVFNKRGAKIRVSAIDGEGSRDEIMAKRVIAAANEHKGPVLVLVGNFHARTLPSGKEKHLGEIVKASLPGVIALDNRYSDGEAWVCSPDCGRTKVHAQDSETDGRWRIELSKTPDDKGFAGVWRIGAARPSDPAVAK